MSRLARVATLAALLILAGCVRRTPPVASPPIAKPPTTAVEIGVALAAPQPLDGAAAERALIAFRTSCPALLKRADSSGLTQPADWGDLCMEARASTPGQAVTFFRDRFEWARIGDGKGFATGYYEPEIAASRNRQPGFDTPIYGLPADLVRCTRADGSEGRGRVDPARLACLPYFTRAEIDDGALVGRGLEIAWAADPVALFFVEIQGSGRLRLADGSVMRIGYAGQNGHPYTAIGKLLRDRGQLPPGGANMAAILAWIAAHPDEGKALLRENMSYIFFKEQTGEGPLGALGVPVTPRTTVAVDPKFIPLGAPVYLALDRREASGLWIAQDTGGAIKGANRVDAFWGAGPDAATIAGGMAAKGEAWVLLPRGTVEHARARP